MNILLGAIAATIVFLLIKVCCLIFSYFRPHKLRVEKKEVKIVVSQVYSFSGIEENVETLYYLHTIDEQGCKSIGSVDEKTYDEVKIGETIMAKNQKMTAGEEGKKD